MKIPEARYRSHLARHLPEPTDLEAVKRDGWLGQHILVVAETDDRLDFVEREFIRRIGERLYGESRKGGRHG
jgi:hypothetical protein